MFTEEVMQIKSNQKSILTKVYGFKPEEIKTANNCSWDIEQCEDQEMTYQARILLNGEVYSRFYKGQIPETGC